MAGLVQLRNRISDLPKSLISGPVRFFCEPRGWDSMVAAQEDPPPIQASAMAQDTRQQQILDLVHQRGFMSIEALAEHFSVTPQTIRRDINQLCDRELLQRYHGGAGLPSSVENTAYQTRQVQGLE